MAWKVRLRFLREALFWAEATANEAIRTGRCLSEDERTIAKEMGVSHPEAIRLVFGSIPLPVDPNLAKGLQRMGIGEGQVAGLALGYAVFIEEESSICSELLAHEFRHVFQFEQVGGLDAFVAEYLRQVAFGYHQAPWEVDARECSKAVK